MQVWPGKDHIRWQGRRPGGGPPSFLFLSSYASLLTLYSKRQSHGLQIDESVVLGLPGNVTGDPNVGVGDQLLFDTGALTNAAHNLTALVLGVRGAQSASGATAIGISGFDYLAGPSVNAVSGCTS